MNRVLARKTFLLSINYRPSTHTETFFMLTEVCSWAVSQVQSTPQHEIPLYCRTTLILCSICSCIPFCPLTHLDFCVRVLMYYTRNEIRCVGFVDHQRNSW